MFRKISVACLILLFLAPSAMAGSNSYRIMVLAGPDDQVFQGTATLSIGATTYHGQAQIAEVDFLATGGSYTCGDDNIWTEYYHSNWEFGAIFELGLAGSGTGEATLNLGHLNEPEWDVGSTQFNWNGITFGNLDGYEAYSPLDWPSFSAHTPVQQQPMSGSGDWGFSGQATISSAMEASLPVYDAIRQLLPVHPDQYPIDIGMSVGSHVTLLGWAGYARNDCKD